MRIDETAEAIVTAIWVPPEFAFWTDKMDAEAKALMDERNAYNLKCRQHAIATVHQILRR